MDPSNQKIFKLKKFRNFHKFKFSENFPYFNVWFLLLSLKEKSLDQGRTRITATSDPNPMKRSQKSKNTFLIIMSKLRNRIVSITIDRIAIVRRVWTLIDSKRIPGIKIHDIRQIQSYMQEKE